MEIKYMIFMGYLHSYMKMKRIELEICCWRHFKENLKLFNLLMELFAKVKKRKGDSDLYRQYCAQRNLVQRSIKVAKSDYFEDCIKGCEGDTSKL